MSATQVKILVSIGLVIGLMTTCFMIGRKYESSSWLDREAKINAAAAKKIKEAAEAASAIEREQAKLMMAEVTKYYQGLEADREKQDDFIAGVVSGRIRVSVATKHPAGGHPEAQGATGAVGVEAAPRAELHDSVTRFLDGEARRADAYTRQLNAVIGRLEACERIGGT